jgi:hypothetical protein
MGELLVGLHKTKHFFIHQLSQKITNSLLIIAFVAYGAISPLIAVTLILASFVIQTAIVLWNVRSYISCRLGEMMWIFTHLRSFMVINYISSILMMVSAA